MNHKTIIKDLKAIYQSHNDSISIAYSDIEITGNRISRIGSNLSSPDAQIVSAKNCVALPGLANTHHHFFQVLTRAVPLMQNMPLFEWLTHHYPVWEGLTEEAIYWASLAVIGELLLT